MGLVNAGSMYIKVPQRCANITTKSNKTCKITCSNTNTINASFCVSSAYSIAFWFKTNTTDLYSYIYSRDSYPIILFNPVTTNGAIAFYPQTLAGVTTTNSYNDDMWHHLVATYDKNKTPTTNLYMDGNLYGSATNTRSPGVIDKPIYLFGLDDTTQELIGKFCNFQFFSGTALNAVEVKKLYNGIPVTNKRVCEFRFDDKNGNVSWDTTKTISGNWYATPTWGDRDIRCWCNHWTEDNWSVTTEAIMDACDRNFLFQNIRPGAVKEQYTILGVPHYADITYSSGNTVILSPIGGFGLSGVTQQRTIAVKNASDSIISPDVYSIKLEGYIL